MAAQPLGLQPAVVAPPGEASARGGRRQAALARVRGRRARRQPRTSACFCPLSSLNVGEAIALPLPLPHTELSPELCFQRGAVARLDAAALRRCQPAAEAGAAPCGRVCKRAGCVAHTATKRSAPRLGLGTCACPGATAEPPAQRSHPIIRTQPTCSHALQHQRLAGSCGAGAVAGDLPGGRPPAWLLQVQKGERCGRVVAGLHLAHAPVNGAACRAGAGGSNSSDLCGVAGLAPAGRK